MNKFPFNPSDFYKAKNAAKPPKRKADLDEDDEESEEGEGQDQQTVVNFTLPYNLIMVSGVINDKTSKMVTEQLLAYDIKNKITGVMQPIHMLINSGGGSVVDAWQICDMMDSIDTPVFTIGSGQIASAALTIFINGEKGFRVLSEHTSVMSHQYSWGVAGKMDDLVSAHREFNNIYTRMESHFQRKTGLTRKVIKEKLLGGLDNWMTSSEAKKMKLADHVLDFKKNCPFIVVQAPPKPDAKKKETKKPVKKEEKKNGKSDNKQ